MADKFQKIAADLEFVRGKNPCFGVSRHGYRLNPPVAPAELVAFEKKHKIELPEDYREYLLRLLLSGKALSTLLKNEFSEAMLFFTTR